MTKMRSLATYVYLVTTCVRWSDALSSPHCNALTYLTILTPRHPGWMVANANFWLRQGIPPIDSESVEIRICGVNSRTVRCCNGCDLGIGREIRNGAGYLEKSQCPNA